MRQTNAPAVSHQTVRLARGQHRSAQDGACVLELASMLAGEPFSDHPNSVCPTIAGFLRAYNDILDDARRQDLYAYAAKVVGTRSSRGVEGERAKRIAEWASRRGRARRRIVRWLSIETSAPEPEADRPEHFATSVAKGLNPVSDETHAEVLALVDELVAMGACGAAATTLTRREEPGYETSPAAVRAPSHGA